MGTVDEGSIQRRIWQKITSRKMQKTFVKLSIISYLQLITLLAYLSGKNIKLCVKLIKNKNTFSLQIKATWYENVKYFLLCAFRYFKLLIEFPVQLQISYFIISLIRHI